MGSFTKRVGSENNSRANFYQKVRGLVNANEGLVRPADFIYKILKDILAKEEGEIGSFAVDKESNLQSIAVSLKEIIRSSDEFKSHELVKIITEANAVEGQIIDLLCLKALGQNTQELLEFYYDKLTWQYEEFFNHLPKNLALDKAWEDLSEMISLVSLEGNQILTRILDFPNISKDAEYLMKRISILKASPKEEVGSQRIEQTKDDFSVKKFSIGLLVIFETNVSIRIKQAANECGLSIPQIGRIGNY